LTSRRHLQPFEQSNLFLDERKLLEAFAYREDVISAGDEQALIERF
jgi:alkylated DNA repair dioxygenase AlkB